MPDASPHRVSQLMTPNTREVKASRMTTPEPQPYRETMVHSAGKYPSGGKISKDSVSELMPSGEKSKTIYINDFLAKQRQLQAEAESAGRQGFGAEPLSGAAKNSVDAAYTTQEATSPHTTSILRLKRTSDGGPASEIPQRSL